MYNLLALDPFLSRKFFITQFMIGLKDELRAAVRLQAPSSITHTSILAPVLEELSMRMANSIRPSTAYASTTTSTSCGCSAATRR